MTLAAGTKLGPYEILSPLGAGGMGEVYRARDARLGREVAVKVLPERFAENLDLRARFEREARAAAAINHPNVVAIYDVGESDGRLYLVTELVSGETLRAQLRPGDASWKRAAEVGAEVAEGLAAAHAKGIVHRDLKPENLMESRDGRVKILDFGLARAEPSPSAGAGSEAPTMARPTEPGAILGTVGYMSPEQVRGQPCDPRTDVFALGCVVFEIASGERAFSGPSPADVMSKILNFDPCVRLEELVEPPVEFLRIVARCMEKDPENRFQSMKDLGFSLRLISGDPRRRDPAPSPAFPSPGDAAGAQSSTSLAVLPFANRSADPENEYFSDGMTEELIGALSRVPGLRVASRTSVFALKGNFQEVREIGRTLNASAILEGSVRRAGERLRVMAQLTNVADGYHLWSDSFDGEWKDVFAVQDAISKRIVEIFRERFGISAATPVPRTSDTRNAHAYQLYWKGRHLWGKRTPEDRMKAIAHFEEAIAADPVYARAYAGLADCFLERGGIGLPAREVMGRARSAAARALELDEALADAHTSLGRVLLYFDRNWKAAEAEFRRAIELDPRYAEGHHSYSHYLLPAGLVAESHTESMLARDLEPLDLGISTHLGWHYLYSGDFDRAVEQCRFAIDMDPTFFYAHFYLAMAHEQRGERAEALREFEEAVRLSPGSAEAEAGRIHALAASGRTAEAGAALSALTARTGSSIDYEVAVARHGLGDLSGAFESLEVALSAREERIIDLNIDPRFRHLRGDARFRELVRKVGAPAGTPPR